MPLEVVNPKVPKYSPRNGDSNPLFWFGDLTKENAEDIATTLKELLVGKLHTVAVAQDGVLNRVHTDNKLEYIKTGPGGSITISDSYGLWFVYPSAYFRFDGEEVYIRHKASAGTELQWAFATQRDPRE